MAWFKKNEKVDLAPICEGFILDCCRYADSQFLTLFAGILTALRRHSIHIDPREGRTREETFRLWLRTAIIAFQTLAVKNVVSSENREITIAAIRYTLQLRNRELSEKLFSSMCVFLNSGMESAEDPVSVMAGLFADNFGEMHRPEFYSLKGDVYFYALVNQILLGMPGWWKAQVERQPI